eukprot:216552-Pelagomonas_calceolata.AAC.7
MKSRTPQHCFVTVNLVAWTIACVVQLCAHCHRFLREVTSAPTWQKKVRQQSEKTFSLQQGVQRVTRLFGSARKTLSNLSGLPDLSFKNLGFGVMKKGQAGGVSPRPGVRVCEMLT